MIGTVIFIRDEQERAVMIRSRQVEKRDGEWVDPPAASRRRPPPVLLDARLDREDRLAPEPGDVEFRRWRDTPARIQER